MIMKSDLFIREIADKQEEPPSATPLAEDPDQIEQMTNIHR